MLWHENCTTPSCHHDRSSSEKHNNEESPVAVVLLILRYIPVPTSVAVDLVYDLA